MLARKNGERLGSLYKEITYENLLENTAHVTESLFDFLNVDSSENIVEQCVSGSSFEKLSGGRAKGQENKNSHFRKGVSGDWKNYFTEDLEKTVYEIAGQLMGEFNYIPSDR
jgi:hypothetical protein